MKRTLVVGFAILAGCTPPPTPAATPVSATAVRASFGKTWGAVVAALAERTINVKTIDKNSGFVTAEAAEVPGDSLKKYTVNCGRGGIVASLFTPSGQSAVMRYNILVKGDSAASSIHVTTQTIMDFGSGVTVKCLTNGVFENSLQDEVKARAEAK